MRLIAKHDELVRVFHERVLIDCERDFKTIATLEDACNTAADFEQIYLYLFAATMADVSCASGAGMKTPQNWGVIEKDNEISPPFSTLAPSS